MDVVSQIGHLATPRRQAQPVLVALSAGAALLAIASANGGYFPTSWGWSSLVFSWVVLLVILFRSEVVLTGERAVFAGATLLLTAWTFVSSAWSWDVGSTVLEGERTLVYASAVVALLLVVRARDVPALLGGVLGAITVVCAYALATRLFTARVDRFSRYRLSVPIGYWNSLGLFAAMGALLALGFVARGRSPVARAAAAAALVLLVPTLYFTFSRGAWLALAIAFLAGVALDPRRLQMCLAALAVAPAAAAAVFASSRATALSTLGRPQAAAIHAGHRLALELAVLAAFAVVLALGFVAVERRFVPGRRVRGIFGGGLLGGLAVAVSAVWLHWGAPPTLASHAWSSFTSAPPATGSNLNARLFQLSSNGRIDLWRASLHEFQVDPAGGTGAGTFETWWSQQRRHGVQVRDAHSLYLETLGELGAVGLGLVLVLVATPLVGAWRTRHTPLVPFAAAAFVAWVVHAGVDWDWEVVAVTLTALACAVVCVAREGGTGVRGGRASRTVGSLLAAAASVFAIVAVIGNQSLAHADTALRKREYPTAEIQARHAARWMPWSGEPWMLIGQIEAISFRPDAARRSFETAIAREPRSYLAWYGLAGVERGTARRRAAAEVIRLNPRSDEAAEMRRLLVQGS